jgi:hypothetical protein
MNKWRAECTQCPTTTDLDYGHEVPVHVEYIDEDNCYAWAYMHNDATKHAVRVSWTMHMDVDFKDIDPEVWKIMTGRTDE